MQDLCIVQIQPRKHVLDYADYLAPTRQRELDGSDQGYICPERSRSSRENRRYARGVTYSQPLFCHARHACL